MKLPHLVRKSTDFDTANWRHGSPYRDKVAVPYGTKIASAKAFYLWAIVRA
jgi:hypothetical protein